MKLIAQLAVPTLKHLLAIEDARTRQLNAIQRTVQAHLEGPYRSALIHLHQASSTDVTAEKRADHLRMAEERFIDALGNFENVEPLQRSWAGIHLAGICAFEGRKGQARDWALQAHADAVIAISAKCAAANDQLEGKIGRVKLLANPEPMIRLVVAVFAVLVLGAALLVQVAVGILVIAVVVGLFAFYVTSVRKRFRDSLDELAALIDECADLIRNLGGPAVARYTVAIEEGLYRLQQAERGVAEPTVDRLPSG